MAACLLSSSSSRRIGSRSAISLLLALLFWWCACWRRTEAYVGVVVPPHHRQRQRSSGGSRQKQRGSSSSLVSGRRSAAPPSATTDPEGDPTADFLLLDEEDQHYADGGGRQQHHHQSTTTTTTTTPSRRAFLGAAAVLVAVVATGSSLPETANAFTAAADYHHHHHPPTSSSNNSNEKQETGSSLSSTPAAAATAQLLADASSSAATTASPSAAAVDGRAVFEQAARRALGGGRAGAAAAAAQVGSLMWLRTSMNYQYRYGGNLQSSLQTLWREGGLARLYQGWPFALVQGPLSKFGDTAANVGILALLEALPATRDWPLPAQTACGSAVAGLWRIVLMPIDASKTAMQVEGAEGLQRLWQSARSVERGGGGPGVLYRGALAQAAATAVGHFPWFLTYNFLDAQLPAVDRSEDLLLSLARSALLGFCASGVSDCSSNSLRVIKTTKQTAQLGQQQPDGGGGGSGERPKELTYPEVVQMIVEQDGIAGLFGRGLQTRLLTNAIQGAAFSVLWKFFQQAN